MTLAPKTYTFLTGCFVALGSILFGYDLGIIASVLPAPDFLRTTGFPSKDFEGFIVSALLLGAFIGCIPSSLVADRLGRRKAILLGSIMFIIGGVLQTAAQNKEMMLVGRLFAGIGIGMLSFLAPLYQSEIAHPSIRGRLTTLQQLFLGIGAFIASFVGYGCTKNYLGTVFQWRFPLALQIAPAIPLASLIFLFPEWLAMVGRHEDALVSLARLHASGDTTDTFANAELQDIVGSIAEEQLLSKSAYRQLFTIPSNFRRLALGVVLQFSVQMTGVSVLQYYSVDIFASIGFGAERTLLFQSINSVLALFGEAACVMWVDKMGRRKPLIVANIISSMTFCVGTAIQAKYPASAGNTGASYAFVMMTWIFNVAFSSAIGPLSWAYPVEIFGTGVRAKATAITSMGCWISNFLIAQVTPKAFAAIGWRYYLVFAICGYTNALTMWAFYPETKGRKLEEMDDYFERTPLFVPFAKQERLDATTRENELAQGITTSGEERSGSHSPADLEKGMAKKSEVEMIEKV